MSEPLTPKQLREKISSGELKIESATQDYIDQYAKEVHDLLVLIGNYMSDDPEDWANSCFVSDESSLGDFFSRLDEDSPTHIMDLSKKLGFKVDRQSYIYEIAARMHGLH